MRSRVQVSLPLRNRNDEECLLRQALFRFSLFPGPGRNDAYARCRRTDARRHLAYATGLDGIYPLPLVDDPARPVDEDPFVRIVQLRFEQRFGEEVDLCVDRGDHHAAVVAPQHPDAVVDRIPVYVFRYQSFAKVLYPNL